jgi:hypothetical protein
MKAPYSIVQPPFDLKFEDRPKKDLVAYRDWFHAVMPERLAELTRAVTSTSRFENWKADLGPDSLGPLGEWFLREVETRKRTEEELGEIKDGLSFPIDVPDEELTNRTFSLAMDIGMYLGQVILKNVPGTSWDQPVKSPKLVDHGQPVIKGAGKVPLNPVRITVTLAYGLAANKETGGGLRTIYDIWSKKLA